MTRPDNRSHHFLLFHSARPHTSSSRQYSLVSPTASQSHFRPTQNRHLLQSHRLRPALSPIAAHSVTEHSCSRSPFAVPSSHRLRTTRSPIAATLQTPLAAPLGHRIQLTRSTSMPPVPALTVFTALSRGQLRQTDPSAIP